MTTAKQKPELWEHQARALDFIREKPGAMLAMEMGTGKTRCAIEHIQELGCQRVLVLCPLSIVDHVWPDQIRQHSGIPMTVIPLGSKLASVSAKQKKAREDLELARARKQPAIVIVNYESSYRAPLGNWLKQQKWDLLIMDESHRIKSPRGEASRWASQMADRVPRRLALTGTPMPHSPMDIYAQYRAINKNVFGVSHHQFRTRYAEFEDIGNPKTRINRDGQTETYQPRKQTDFQNLDELQEKFHRLAFRVTAAETLNLPKVVETYTRIEMTKKARTIYDQMALEFKAELESGEIVTAANALSRLLRFQQLTSGFAATEDGKVIQVDDSKARALSDILEDLPHAEPVVVFARFRNDLSIIAETAAKLSRPCFEISGQVKQLDEWNRDGGVLAVQIQAGGLGLDLTKARYCVYYSLGFSLGDYQQSIARLHRPGQTSMVDYIHLVTARSVDGIVTKALEDKEVVIEAILRTGNLMNPSDGI